jgi:hypothetical protein
VFRAGFCPVTHNRSSCIDRVKYISPIFAIFLANPGRIPKVPLPDSDLFTCGAPSAGSPYGGAAYRPASASVT